MDTATALAEVIDLVEVIGDRLARVEDDLLTEYTSTQPEIGSAAHQALVARLKEVHAAMRALRSA
jgi:hypothetical protein